MFMGCFIPAQDNLIIDQTLNRSSPEKKLTIQHLWISNHLCEIQHQGFIQFVLFLGLTSTYDEVCTLEGQKTTLEEIQKINPKNTTAPNIHLYIYTEFLSLSTIIRSSGQHDQQVTSLLPTLGLQSLSPWHCLNIKSSFRGTTSAYMKLLRTEQDNFVTCKTRLLASWVAGLITPIVFSNSYIR